MNFEHQYNTVQQPLRETPLISIHRMLIQSQSHDVTTVLIKDYERHSFKRLGYCMSIIPQLKKKKTELKVRN